MLQPVSSGWCVRGGISAVTESLGAGRSCTAVVTGTGLLSVQAESAHVVCVPDSAVGEAYQLRVWWDRDGDGTRQGAPDHPAREPSETVEFPIAKADVSYVALGDSFSSGEQGDLESEDSEGGYEADMPSDGSPSADEYCHRWNLAYPYVFMKEFLGDESLAIEVTSRPSHARVRPLSTFTTQGRSGMASTRKTSSAPIGRHTMCRA